MNELYLFLQVLFVLLFTYGTFYLGKEALIVAVALQALIANLFVLKQITFLGFEVTSSDAYAIGSILGLNLLREYFGKESAKKAIFICFFFLIFFVTMSQIHLHFLPSPHDTTQFAYAKLLSPAPRLLIASLTTFFIVQHFDLYLFGWISKLLPRIAFPIRGVLSIMTSELLDTILFSFLGLLGIVESIIEIIFISYLIKLTIILFLAPLTTVLKRVRPRV